MWRKNKINYSRSMLSHVFREQQYCEIVLFHDGAWTVAPLWSFICTDLLIRTTEIARQLQSATPEISSRRIFLRSLYIRILQFLQLYQSPPPPPPPPLSATVNLFRRQWLCSLRETNIACHKHHSSWPTYDKCTMMTAKNGVELLNTWENSNVAYPWHFSSMCIKNSFKLAFSISIKGRS